MFSVVKETSNSIDWLNITYVLTATIVAAGVIVRSVRKMARKAMEEVVDERISPHLKEDADKFTAIDLKLDRIARRRNP